MTERDMEWKAQRYDWLLENDWSAAWQGEREARDRDRWKRVAKRNKMKFQIARRAQRHMAARLAQLEEVVTAAVALRQGIGTAEAFDEALRKLDKEDTDASG